jgi:hypothetical protein
VNICRDTATSAIWNVAKVEWHLGELYPRVGFIVTNPSRPTRDAHSCECAREHVTGHAGQAKRVVQLAIWEQSRIGGDRRAAKLEHQPAVKIEPQRLPAQNCWHFVMIADSVSWGDDRGNDGVSARFFDGEECLKALSAAGDPPLPRSVGHDGGSAA